MAEWGEVTGRAGSGRRKFGLLFCWAALFSLRAEVEVCCSEEETLFTVVSDSDPSAGAEETTSPVLATGGCTKHAMSAPRQYTANGRRTVIQGS